VHQKRFQHVQRGGEMGLLDNADGAPITNHIQMTFTVRYQPTVKAAIFGPVFTAEQTRPEPQVIWTAPVAPIQYTLICWDPDATAKSWLHWLVINCSGTDPSTGTELAKWNPPMPPPSSGQHRYIFGLFQQAAALNIPKIGELGNFHVANFATQNGLTPLAYTGFRINT